ncbi:MAG: response regulator, partial [Elusimicrobiota bacterium]
RDLSERKKAEEDLQASREQLLQSQKLEAVGRLAGGVAHDFNNLCTVIRGCADFLGKNTPPDDPRREDIDEIAQAGARAANLTRQLLALSRKQVLQPKTLSLGTIVLGMRSMLERTLGEDITLLTQLSAEAAPVRVDPGQIEQVLLNLAVNAREAMPRGGKLIIGCADVRSGKEYRPKGSTIPPGNYVCLTVSDTGCGMDAATKERAFEPFFTTKGFGQSSGLGLSTAYGIVRQSGGYMSLDSEVGRGTTFKIHLPAAAGADEQTPAKRAPAVRGSGTILLVEDDARVRRTARRALEAAGYTVIEADCGAAALRLLERDKPEFDLLVTDVIMPEMDGPQLVDEIARRRPGVPTLYMSGYTGEMLIMRGILEEDEAFLAKPFTPDDLAHKVAAVLAAHRRG